MQTRWQYREPDPDVVTRLSQNLGCDPITATVMANRGLTDVAQARAFMQPSLSGLRAPDGIKDLDKAVQRIHQAIVNNERILIFGDYDVDGVTATTLLLEFFRNLGQPAGFYIPHRTREGYSFKPEHVQQVALPANAQLIITVDCGSSNHEAVEAAHAAGIDVIVSDHHPPPDRLPPAVAVVNPNRADCPSGLGFLSGVGVAFYLLAGVRRHMREQRFFVGRAEPNLSRVCDLVALGTIADLVPLQDENRILTAAGLRQIRTGRRPGLLALAEATGTAIETLDSQDIAYRLAPRLNAAGRMGHAKTAVDLLICRDMTAARGLARSLENLNARRQQAENDALGQIDEALEANPEYLDSRSLVLWHRDWHEGILGIAASRLAKRHFRPVVLLSTRSGAAKGSARSIPGFDLNAGLEQCADYLTRFGGHAMAAGLELNPQHLPEFQRRFDQVVRNQTRQDDFIPALAIDCDLTLDRVNDRLLNELESLAPYGSGHREALFGVRNVKVLSARVVGKRHLKLQLQQPLGSDQSAPIEAIAFNRAQQWRRQRRYQRMAVRLTWNRYNGQQKPQLIVEDARLK